MCQLAVYCTHRKTQVKEVQIVIKIIFQNLPGSSLDSIFSIDSVGAIIKIRYFGNFKIIIGHGVMRIEF